GRPDVLNHLVGPPPFIDAKPLRRGENVLPRYVDLVEHWSAALFAAAGMQLLVGNGKEPPINWQFPKIADDPAVRLAHDALAIDWFNSFAKVSRFRHDVHEKHNPHATEQGFVLVKRAAWAEMRYLYVPNLGFASLHWNERVAPGLRNGLDGSL